MCVRILLLLLVVWGVAGARAEARQADDTQEIASYRLTSAAFQKVVNINRAVAQQMAQDPAVREAMKVEKEIAALEDKDELSEADEKRLESLRVRQEQLEASSNNPLGGDTKSLAEMEARIAAYPPLKGALAREGMAPREYAKFWMAFIQAAFAHGFRKSGMLKELPPGVNAENVKFIDEHAAEIEAMQKEFGALGK